ncbi:NAD-dependent epimerase/dehydratase [Candidatus Sulfotelmatobacter sp. SbA7]|jgi:nucleoside-diphosphate-sugar epimerase|nr:NAD-dependent epimerase/dehydratase [Candidatus Sulfotelmatobacter sp. SbA7]
MHFLIIGGTKFIGPHVVRQLVEQGHEVVVYHRGQTEAQMPAGVRHIRSAQAAIPVLVFSDEALAERFDVVVHMIAMGEADARAAVEAFRGRAGRLVVVSSGDVYLAYGRFTGIEPGPLEPVPLHEGSPLRSVLYPYREKAAAAADWTYSYEKILVEREVMGDAALPGTVLRLPKVYGPGGNADLATVYAMRNHPQWRWTHGYVENVAAAIVLAAMHPAAAGRVYNVGEERTPTVAERMAGLRASTVASDENNAYNFGQDIVYDTGRIRAELGYEEIVAYEEGLRRTLER